MFLRDVKSVEGVEQGEPITLRQQKRLPLLPCRFVCKRYDSFDDDHLGPEPLPIAAKQDGCLATLDINLEEVDLLHRVPFTYLCERQYRHANGSIIGAELRCVPGVFFHGRG